MKKTLTLAALLFSVTIFGQTKTTLINKETLIDSSLVDSGEEKQVKQAINYFTNNKNTAYWQYNNNGNKFLYKIKADGTFELGDLLIEAVVVGLQQRGYRLVKNSKNKKK